MAADAINVKIKQAEFHLDKMKSSVDSFEIQTYFSALLACIRSVVFYAETWMIENHRVADKKAWLAKLHAWEATLASNDREHWKVLTRARNTDIHEAPVIPGETFEGGWFGPWLGNWMGNYMGGATVRRIVGPSGASYDILAVSERGIDVAKQLLIHYAAF